MDKSSGFIQTKPRLVGTGLMTLAAFLAAIGLLMSAGCSTAEAAKPVAPAAATARLP
jgi:hypothetical protein